MVHDTIICIKNLVPRETSENIRYQNFADSPVLCNYDRLCIILHGTTGKEVSEYQQQNHFTVHPVHHITRTMTSNDDKIPNKFDSPGLSVAQENEVPAVVEQKDKMTMVMVQNNGVSVVSAQKDKMLVTQKDEMPATQKNVSTTQKNKVPVAQKEKVPTTQKLSNVPIVDPAEKEERGRRENVTVDLAGKKSVRCVDFKSIVKLSRLCYILNSNVMELKLFYENKGYSYSKAKYVTFEPELRSLVNDMPKLLNILNEISVHRDKIRLVVDIYSSYESRYRELRRICSMCAKSSQNTGRAPRNDEKYGLSTVIKEYACEIFNWC
ncbi:Hypothetical protein CINCED_3A001633 [Cinara cedri]|uniref:Uncharacterized protein n=1 Tax=Cinara cedri TaxID=506608 RepID=A0A5E4MDP3_9HEMI|nr:Hypothetical protein CINCED_3A001633 [Cinara cedri]